MNRWKCFLCLSAKEKVLHFARMESDGLYGYQFCYDCMDAMLLGNPELRFQPVRREMFEDIVNGIILSEEAK